MMANADKALADESVDEGRPEGLRRVIRRAPVGVTLLVGAWNVSLIRDSVDILLI
jgi:acyl-CoA reductase-like NAD-dependent aldehyde dehydrogenase